MNSSDFVDRYIVITIDFIFRLNNAICRRGLEKNNILDIKVLYDKKYVGAILDVYTNGNITNIESRRFMAYIERFVKTNKSKNDINYRIASLYNYIISKYSDFIEINQIIQNEEEQY